MLQNVLGREVIIHLGRHRARIWGTWDPELRIETLDPDRNWIACFIHDTGFNHNRSREGQALLTS
jgi:hypothetical protein